MRRVCYNFSGIPLEDSSLICASYALRKTVLDHKDRYLETDKAVLKNFLYRGVRWLRKKSKTSIKLSRSLIDLLKLGGLKLSTC